MEIDAKKTATLFKAFGDENRIKILQMLGSGEKCACVMLEDLQVSQPTLSHHMKILCDAGVVSGRKEGKWMHYSISQDGAEIAREALQDITAVHETEQSDDDCEKCR